MPLSSTPRNVLLAVKRCYSLGGNRPSNSRSKGSKAERAQPLAALAEGGKVYYAQGEWHRDFFDEIETVPSGAHDDQVDAASLAVAKFEKKQEFWFI